MKASNKKYKKVSKKDITALGYRSLLNQAIFNYERMQNIGFTATLTPCLKKIYKDDKKKLAEVTEDNLEFINTHNVLVPFLEGLMVSLYEGDEDPETVKKIKISMFGPLAGIGDAIFWFTVMPIMSGICASLASEGNVLGPILYFLVYNIPSSLARHLLPVIGFNLGTSFFEKMNKNGIMPFLTECCNIVGLIMVGSMACTMVTLKVPFVYEAEGATINVQEILDSILPNALPLGLTLLCFWLLKKKNVSPTILIILLVVVAIALHAVGIL